MAYRKRRGFKFKRRGRVGRRRYNKRRSKRGLRIGYRM